MILCDPSSERAVLSCILHYGDKAYLEINDLISENTFTIDSNQFIYSCVKYLFDKEDTKTIDIASIYSAAQNLGLLHILQKKEEAQHLKAIKDFPADIENLKKFASKIKKLEIARSLHKELENAQEKLLDISGSESISSILGIAEDTLLDFGSNLSNDNEPSILGKDIESYLDYLIENPIDQMGISSGYPIYDQSIGGGFRKGTINVIAARPKVGKSLWCDNVSLNVAGNLGIPVLNMDTEMNSKDHIHRMLAMMTEIEINNIETGRFSKSPSQYEKIKEASEKLQKMPVYYKSIAGKPFDEQLGLMRRWIHKDVGTNPDGTAKDCLIIYDYLKLMDSNGISQDMKEYQVLGFMMTSLHNFAVKYQLPILAFIQLNRDGISKESTDTASGSDRIIWLCSNFSIFKRKSDEEIAEDGIDSGNRKLIPLISRHGAGLDDNDYINFNMKGWCAKITEGSTKLELSNSTSKKKDGFIINDNNNEEEQISFA
jgi:replicative DNA helicase